MHTAAQLQTSAGFHLAQAGTISIAVRGMQWHSGRLLQHQSAADPSRSYLAMRKGQVHGGQTFANLANRLEDTS